MTEQAPRAKTELRKRFSFSAADYIVALQASKDGRFGVAGTGDGRLLAFDLSSGKELFVTNAHAAGVLSVGISPDGQWICTGGQDPCAKLWSANGELVRELPSGTKSWVEHVAWAPAGQRLATAAGRKVRIWSDRGEPQLETEPLESTVAGISWRADGTGLAAACYGGVHLLPFVKGAKVRHFDWKGSLISVAWSPDAKVIACGSQDCSIHFWRVSSGADSEMRGYPFKPKALAWDHESKLLASSGDATVTVWDFRGKGPEGTRPFRLQSHQGACTQLAFAPRKSILASGSQDTSILLWEPRKSERPTRFAFLEDEVTSLAWHPEGHTLLGADASGTICAWEAS